MLLSEYLADRDLTLDAFGAAVGLRASSVSKLSRGLIKPSFDTLVRIEAVTGGCVTAADFMRQHSVRSDPSMEAA